MSKKQRDNFEQYIKTEFLSIFKVIPELNIIHENSQDDEGLQVVDFVCGAFGYKYNTANLKGDFQRYVDIFKDKIVMEKINLFKEK